MNKLQHANQYIKEKSMDIKKRPLFHFSAPVGWLNDPNGFSQYKGEYHLFYQYYPYDTKWGPMHWGHAKSKDLIKWDHMPVALAPDRLYDINGCFSGSAIEHEDKLYLMYTGHIDPNIGYDPILDHIEENQNIAISEDGINFTKHENNPVIDESKLPLNAIPRDFRDPKIFKKNDNFYCVIASRNKEDNSGQILLFKSKDLYNWEFVSVIAQSKNKIGEMWECPDLFTLDTKDLLIISTMFDNKDKENKNIHGNVILLGKMDYDKGELYWDSKQQIDYGFDFYAAQTMLDQKGRRILIAWMQMWERNIPSEKYGWAGMMTIPRELYIKNNKVYQRPIEEIKKYYNNQVSYKNQKINGIKTFNDIKGNTIDVEMEIDLLDAKEFGCSVLKGQECETVIKYNIEKKELVFDRSKSGVNIQGQEKDEDSLKGIRRVKVNTINNILKLRVIIDKMSIEIFINDGEKTMSSTVYPQDDAQEIQFTSKGQVNIISLTKWDIII